MAACVMLEQHATCLGTYMYILVGGSNIEVPMRVQNVSCIDHLGMAFKSCEEVLRVGRAMTNLLKGLVTGIKIKAIYN